jgi:SNF2 family DNA or RNA helicase
MNALNVQKDAVLSANHKAFGYQLEAFEAICKLEYAGIFHEQGLGKTKIAIDLLLHWLSSGDVDSVIIVVKKGLLTNWKKELAVHTKIKPKILSQNKNENFFAFNSPSRVYLCHFEVFKSEQSRLDIFLKTRKVGVIIDEGQKLKNPNSDLTKVFFRLGPGFVRRVIVTGTPVANRPYDIWALVRFLDGGKSLGSDFREFKKHHDFSSEQETDDEARGRFETALSEIHAKISHFTVRETKSGADISLPQKEIRNIYADWETVQREMYLQVKNDFRLVISKAGIVREDESEEILKRLLRLVQIASNPQLVDASYGGEPGKLHALNEILSRVIEQKEKAIVWTSFTENADWLLNLIRSACGAVKLHGKMAMPDRDRAIQKFSQEDSVRVLVATPGAAKEGLTLTAANHVIFYDRSFSLDDYLQAQDRIHRISQTKTCFVYNLVMRDSVDEWVDVLLKQKELAAKFATGDLSKEEYQSRATYSMHTVLNGILN